MGALFPFSFILFQGNDLRRSVVESCELARGVLLEEVSRTVLPQNPGDEQDRATPKRFASPPGGNALPDPNTISNPREPPGTPSRAARTFFGVCPATPRSAILIRGPVAQRSVQGTHNP